MHITCSYSRYTDSIMYAVKKAYCGGWWLVERFHVFKPLIVDKWVQHTYSLFGTILTFSSPAFFIVSYPTPLFISSAFWSAFLCRVSSVSGKSHPTRIRLFFSRLAAGWMVDGVMLHVVTVLASGGCTTWRSMRQWPRVWPPTVVWPDNHTVRSSPPHA